MTGCTCTALAMLKPAASDWVTTALADVRDADLTGVRAVFIDPAANGPGPAACRGQPTLRRTARGWPTGSAGWPSRPRRGCRTRPFRRGGPGEFVAVGRELKEAVAWSPAQATAARRATILPAGDTLVQATYGEPAACAAAGSG